MLLAASAFAGSDKRLVQGLVSDLVNTLHSNIGNRKARVSIGPIYQSGTHSQSEFSAQVALLLYSEFGNKAYQGQFISVDQPSEAIDINQLAPSEVDDDAESTEPQRIELLCKWLFSPGRDKIGLECNLQLKNGEIVSSATIEIPVMNIPWKYISENPSESAATDEMEKSEELSNIKSAFNIWLGTDHTNNIYRVGQNMHLLFSTQKACHLFIQYKDASGCYCRVYPVKDDPIGPIPAGKPVLLTKLLPINISDPPGDEFMTAFCQSRPWDPKDLDALKRCGEGCVQGVNVVNETREQTRSVIVSNPSSKLNIFLTVLPNAVE